MDDTMFTKEPALFRVGALDGFFEEGTEDTTVNSEAPTLADADLEAELDALLAND